MSASLLEWLNLLIRWIHVVAGIMWVGTSLFFVWMENNLKKGPGPDGSHVEELKMVHGGGFWHVQKKLFEPGQIPDDLHWFKWEAYATWLSGSALLIVVYYLTEGFLTDPAVASLSHFQAVGAGLGALVLGWVLYDGLWRSPLSGNRPACAAISFGLLIGAAYALTHLLSGRAAFIHIGAMLGTMMAANVFMHIIPNQRRVIAAVREGREHDLVRSEQARLRSRANNYMTLPVVFIMISNHYPSLYGSDRNWVVLAVLILAGAGVNHFLNLKETSERWEKTWFPASAVTVLAAFSAIHLLTGKPAVTSGGAIATAPATFHEAQAVIEKRCVACHSQAPVDDVFKAPPQGVAFDTPAQIHALAGRIKARAVDDRTMPLANKTGMTDGERDLLARWIAQGARTE